MDQRLSQNNKEKLSTGFACNEISTYPTIVSAKD